MESQAERARLYTRIKKQFYLHYAIAIDVTIITIALIITKIFPQSAGIFLLMANFLLVYLHFYVANNKSGKLKLNWIPVLPFKKWENDQLKKEISRMEQDEGLEPEDEIDYNEFKNLNEDWRGSDIV